MFEPHLFAGIGALGLPDIGVGPVKNGAAVEIDAQAAGLEINLGSAPVGALTVEVIP